MSDFETEARILSRSETRVSPWVRLVGKKVLFSADRPAEVYHCLAQADYIAILARTRDGRVPLVSQYRPAVEATTWELPAGLLESGEDPETACVRELKEETGLDADSVINLGSYYADTGRLENMQHVFYVQASNPDPMFVPEPGLSVEFVTVSELQQYILSGKFRHQLHLGVFSLAALRGVKLMT